MQENRVNHGDFLTNTLPDKSVQLIIADPPYFEVMGEFDFIWETFDDYLADVEKWAKECERILADNGTILWYGDSRKIAYSQIVLDRHFDLLNHIVWEKMDCQTRKSEPESCRRFQPVTERVLMYHKGEDKSGLAYILADPALFRNIKQYFDDWLEKSPLTYKEAIQQIGSSASHWFGFTKKDKTQFMFPTLKQWEKMDQIFPHWRTYDETQGEYKGLRTEYEDLRLEYEAKRRFFEFPTGKTMGDVLHFSQESENYKKYGHLTVKPEKLTRLFIKATSRVGDLVFVPFSGSGTECAMAIKEGRRCIGYDLNEQYVETGNARIIEQQNALKLFY